MKKVSIKLIVIILIGIFYANSINAQKYVIVGNVIIRIDTVKKPVKKSFNPTKLTYTIKGRKYIVYKSARGSYFILKTSKKTKKMYKQYFRIKS